MTEEEIKAGLALCEAATPGPWEPCTKWLEGRGWCALGPETETGDHDDCEADAFLIAAARTLLPEALRELQEERVVSERRRQERADALNVKTTDGLTSSEWILRTGKAERERDEALRELERLRRVERAARALLATGWHCDACDGGHWGHDDDVPEAWAALRTALGDA